ncbi:5-hydroxyisourate hydrolase-like [Homarus americanus]|uniref:5-hydroxyisourate hydrolase n=1 Tax=Homarus americanus TaxID=6706 RepID=A0A8J5N0P7_HOMAM|nr:5-hydroxyisourate hydrolase-like [Homarus americanus]KAG7171068.1 5-hydroxyisourate hydrolase-like [Homarus americanus]
MPVDCSRLQVIQKHLESNQKVPSVSLSNVNMSGNPLTCHVLNTATGKPAANMKITLHCLYDGNWQKVADKVTNSDGRTGQFLTQEAFTQGTYKMFFDTGDYFKQLGTSGFYPYVEIVFIIEKPEEHYHIPLLLSPYGYTTYRGS